MGCGRNLCHRVIGPPTEGNRLCIELDAGTEMDREKCNEVSRVKAPTEEAKDAIDYKRRIELFQTACMEVKRIWNTVSFVVQDNVNLLAANIDEKSYEEAPKGISSVPGENWVRRF